MCEDTVTLWQRRCTHSGACTAMIQPTVTGVSPHAAQVSKVAATSTAPHTVKDTQHTSQFAQSTMEWKHTAQCIREVGEGGRPLGGVERLRWLLAEPPEKAFRLNYLSFHQSIYLSIHPPIYLSTWAKWSWTNGGFRVQAVNGLH